MEHGICQHGTRHSVIPSPGAMTCSMRTNSASFDDSQSSWVDVPPEAAEAVSTTVGDTDADVLEGMASLLDKSLLQRTERDGGEPRFAMLETIREYGLEVLASGGEAQATRQAHAAYYLALAEQAEPELSGPQQLTWFEQLEREHDNLRAALSWFQEQSSDGQSSELALRLCGALWQFWLIRGYVSEGRQWL